MGDFKKVADRIAASIFEKMKNEGGVSVDKIPQIVAESFPEEGGEVNCYPGVPSFHCFEIAFFVSLCSPPYRKGRGHLTCRQAMEKIVQHMQGACYAKTHVAVLFTDNWDAPAFDEWRANLKKITDQHHIEIYLFLGKTVSEITL